MVGPSTVNPVCWHWNIRCLCSPWLTHSPSTNSIPKTHHPSIPGWFFCSKQTFTMWCHHDVPPWKQFTRCWYPTCFKFQTFKTNLDQPDQMSDHLKLDRSVRRLYLSTHTNHIPYHPCIVKVPTFTIKNERNVGKNTIDPKGISRIYQALAYFKGPKSSQIIWTRTDQKGSPTHKMCVKPS